MGICSGLSLARSLALSLSLSLSLSEDACRHMLRPLQECMYDAAGSWNVLYMMHRMTYADSIIPCCRLMLRPCVMDGGLLA